MLALILALGVTAVQPLCILADTTESESDLGFRKNGTMTISGKGII